MSEQLDSTSQTTANDLSYSENVPVTGQGRMDAAWGSKDGDESTTAQVTSNNASVGYVFEQIYKPWNGPLNPRWMRNWAILRHHVLAYSVRVTDRGVCQQSCSLSLYLSPHLAMLV